MKLSIDRAWLAKLAVVTLGGMAAQFAHAGGAYYDLGAGITVSGASADGSVAAAYDGSTFYKWTAAGGVKSIGGYWEGGVASVSADGTLISGSATGTSGTTQAAFYDVASRKWTTVGGVGGVSGTSESSGWGIAGNGKSLVGLGWVDAGTAHAVQSTPAGTLADLGAGGFSSRANGVNYDGTTVVGWEEQSSGFWQGTYWRNGVATLMYDNNGIAMNEGNAVSADGTWIVGDGGNGTDTWRYNTITGATQSLGDLDPLDDVQASTGISADGKIIVGYDRSFGPPTFGSGSIWIDGLGMMNLTDYALAQGIDLHGRTLALPLGISADGTTVYGLDNKQHGFVVSLSPVPEPGTWLMLGFGLVGLVVASRRKAATT